MATETSSIDDLLSQSLTTPQAQKQVEVEEEIEVEENDEVEASEVDYETQPEAQEEESQEEPKEDEPRQDDISHDEYGNEKPAPRTYTEDEVNEMFRKRFARGNHQTNQPTINPQEQQQLTNQAKDFEYNPNAEGDWQQQLEQFVEQTFNKIGQRQVAQQQAAKEQQAESEFIDKFNHGMERFTDFRDVVSAQPVTDAMALALRGVNDPAAFIYAASKRHPAELQRISQIKDPYAQIKEMGNLEERMKKQPQSTQAPRPIGRHQEDAPPLQQKKKNTEPSIEDLIASSDKRKMAMMKQKRGR